MLDLPVTYVGTATAAEYEPRLQKVIDQFSEQARSVMKKEAISIVVTDNKSSNGSLAEYNTDTKIARLPINIDADDLKGYPKFLHEHFSNFESIAAHELMHSVIRHVNLKFLSDKFSGFLSRIKEKAEQIAPNEADMIKKALRSSDRQLFKGLDIDISAMSKEKQLAVLLRTLGSPAFYRYAGYGDTLGEAMPEIICNINALCQAYGKENVRKLTGDFLDKVDEVAQECAESAWVMGLHLKQEQKKEKGGDTARGRKI